MVRLSLALTTVLLLTCAPALAQPPSAPKDPTLPETAKDDHKLQPEDANDDGKLQPETAHDDDKLQPEDATDTPIPSKRERDAEIARRGVRSNTPAPPPHEPPG